MLRLFWELLEVRSMSLLPYINSNGEIEDGTLFHILPFCKNHCNKEKCKNHYQKMETADVGCYCCPYGLSTYLHITPKGKTVFTGLRVRNYYDKKKAKVTNAAENVFNPIIPQEVCISIASEMSATIVERQNLEDKIEAIRDLLHEARSLNGQIKNSIDILWENNEDENDMNYDTMLETLKNAHVSSVLISNRFSYFDSIINPTLSMGSPFPAVVFKKFDKMRKLLKGYQRKNVWISLNSPVQSAFKYRIYPTFETLLFILLENAIKYSPDDKPVEVFFDEKGEVLDVTIKSIGPYCDENELLHLCEKGFRGENAKTVQSKGQGFGLNFAKKICDLHNIDISFESVYSYKDHGVYYGSFIVRLHFDNNGKS